MTRPGVWLTDGDQARLRRDSVNADAIVSSEYRTRDSGSVRVISSTWAYIL